MKIKRLSDKKLFGSAFLRMRSALSSMAFIVLAIGVLIVFYVQPGLFAPIRSSFLSISAPVIDAINVPFRAARSGMQAFHDYWSLREINARLRQENEILRAWQQEAQSLRADNAALRSLMNLRGADFFARHKVLSTRILNDTSTDFAKSTLIAVGRGQGVKLNAAVMCAQGLMGRVIETADNTARVLLLSDINARIPVVVRAQDDGQLHHAIMSGQNDRLPTLSYLQNPKALPEDLSSWQGAYVMTSGAGGVYPYGIPVGKIVPDGQGGLSVEPFMRERAVVYVSVFLGAEEDQTSAGGSADGL